MHFSKYYLYYQDRWEKHQQRQICGLYHSKDRKWRGIKEPLDEGEGGEWKSRLKTKYWKNLDHGIRPHYFTANRRGKCGSSDRFPFLGAQNHSGCWLQPWNQKAIASWQEGSDKPTQCVEKQRLCSANEGLYSQGYSNPSGHILLWELDHKEGRMPKNWCLRAVVLEKNPESPLDRKEIKPVNLKGNQPQVLIGMTDWESPWCWERFRAVGE